MNFQIATTTIYKRFINNETIQYFRILLNNVTWEEVENTDCPEKACNTFLDKFQVIYDQAFPKTKIKLKTKSLLSPWITKGLLKSSKTKHKLYDKYLKSKTYRNEIKYKSYKNLFESIKHKLKNIYYTFFLL